MVWWCVSGVWTYLQYLHMDGLDGILRRASVACTGARYGMVFCVSVSLLVYLLSSAIARNAAYARTLHGRLVVVLCGLLAVNGGPVPFGDPGAVLACFAILSLCVSSHLGSRFGSRFVMMGFYWHMGMASIACTIRLICMCTHDTQPRIMSCACTIYASMGGFVVWFGVASCAGEMRSASAFTSSRACFAAAGRVTEWSAADAPALRATGMFGPSRP